VRTFVHKRGPRFREKELANMQSRSLAAVLCAGLLAMPVVAANTPKDVDGDKLPAGQFTGKLVSTPGTDGSFTVNVETDRVELKQGAARTENRDVQQLMRDQQRVEQTQSEIARARNPSEYRRLMNQLVGEMQRLQVQAARLQRQEGGDYTVKKDHKNIDFHTADDVKVRIMSPPVQFDDKGNPKQYTKEELDALKGKDKDLPGYESTIDSLKVGDTVQVTLKPPKSEKKDGDKDSDPKKDAEAQKSNEVTLIVIQAQASSDNSKKK
jgi:hypothetical protein